MGRKWKIWQVGSGMVLLATAGLHAWCAAMPAPAVAVRNFYSFSLVKPGGTVVPLSEYRGKVVVVVNLASKSSYAEQVGTLEKLQAQYKDQGLVVVGVPSNDFGAEEPGDDAAIQKLYAGEHVTFPVMAKSVVCGKDELPVYGFLTASGKAKPGVPGGSPEGGAVTATGMKDEVHWSFTKFIVTREGQVGARFEPDVTPESPEFQIAIQKALAGKLKQGGKHPVGGGGGDEDDGDDDGGM